MKIIILLMCCFVFTSCEPKKDCHYDIYQGGLKIDSVVLKEYECRSERESPFSDIYYKHIKK